MRRTLSRRNSFSSCSGLLSKSREGFQMITKSKVLLLAVNPVDDLFPRLRLAEEAREISKAIQSGTKPDLLELITQWAVRPGDLQEALLTHKPQIVHFSGHGDLNAIFFESDNGNLKPVDKSAIAEL